MDVFIRHYDRTNHLVLFGCEKYAAIFDRIRYLIWLLVFSHNHAEIKELIQMMNAPRKKIDFANCCNNHKISF